MPARGEDQLAASDEPWSVGRVLGERGVAIVTTNAAASTALVFGPERGLPIWLTVAIGAALMLNLLPGALEKVDQSLDRCETIVRHVRSWFPKR